MSHHNCCVKKVLLARAKSTWAAVEIKVPA